MDDAQHRQGTGQGNTRILENLRHLSRECACDIWVRVPIIPGYNDSEENIRQLSCFVKENLTHCSQVHLLPFHTLGEGKFEELERFLQSYSLRGTHGKVARHHPKLRYYMQIITGETYYESAFLSYKTAEKCFNRNPCR